MELTSSRLLRELTHPHVSACLSHRSRSNVAAINMNLDDSAEDESVSSPAVIGTGMTRIGEVHDIEPYDD